MVKFEILNESHVDLINEFSCKDEIEVESFLKKDALEFQYNNCATTRLCIDNNRLIGYFSLYNDTIYIGKRKLDKHKWEYPNGLRYFPALKVYCLGVDDRYREKGYGREIMVEIFDIAIELNDYSGCAFITLEAKEDSIGYYEHFYFERHGREQFQNMILNVKTLR